MALGTNLKMIELVEVGIAKLLTDSATAPTYDTLVKLQGATKITVSPKTDTKKLQGDSKLLDVYQRTTEIELDVELAMLPVSALPIIMGGTVTASGTTPNQTTVYSLEGSDTTPPYFKIEGRWTYAGEGIGDAHVVLYKVKATDMPQIEINDANGNFGTVKFKGLALPCISNDSWLDIKINETASVLS